MPCYCEALFLSVNLRLWLKNLLLGTQNGGGLDKQAYRQLHDVGTRCSLLRHQRSHNNQPGAVMRDSQGQGCYSTGWSPTATAVRGPPD